MEIIDLQADRLIDKPKLQTRGTPKILTRVLHQICVRHINPLLTEKFLTLHHLIRRVAAHLVRKGININTKELPDTTLKTPIHSQIILMIYFKQY